VPNAVVVLRLRLLLISSLVDRCSRNALLAQSAEPPTDRSGMSPASDSGPGEKRRPAGRAAAAAAGSERIRYRREPL